MRYDNLYISGIGAWLPKQTTADEAIAQGRYDFEAQKRSLQRSVAIAGPDDGPPVMAVRAGRAALDMSAHQAGDVSLLLHAVAVYAGMDGWNSASYLQQEILGGAGLAFEVRQVSNGGLAAVELAAAYLAMEPGRTAALITAADCFPAPAWDRWRADSGLVFGDGAGALVLSRTGGFARLRSLVTVSDSTLEGLHRGDAPFRAFPDPADHPLDLRSRAVAFTETMDLEEIHRRGHDGLRRAVSQAVAEAGTSVAAAAHCAVPHFGRDLLGHQVLEPLGIEVERTTWSLGSEIGHVGAADPFVGLTRLAETGALQPGSEVLLVSLGGGFNWTCAVVEILADPGNDLS